MILFLPITSYHKHITVSRKTSKPPSSETETPENKQSRQWLVILFHMLAVTGLKLSPRNSS
jgi:hypothetical protein